MARIRIEDLPAAVELTAEERRSVQGGSFFQGFQTGPVSSFEGNFRPSSPVGAFEGNFAPTNPVGSFEGNFRPTSKFGNWA